MRQFFLLLVGLTFYNSPEIWAAPVIDNFDGVFGHSKTIIVVGSGFGDKETPDPKYFNNFEQEEEGAIPSGLSLSAGSVGGVVSTGLAHGLGSKSMEFNFYSTGRSDFERNVFDLGVGGSDTVYISTWLFLDKEGSTATDNWQWKGMYISSESNGYSSSDPFATSVVINSWWYPLYDPDKWGNNSFFTYYNGLTNGMSAGLSSDGYLWGEWQRVEIQAKSSTAPGVNDAQLKVTRIGRPGGNFLCNTTTAISHGDGDRPWRYVALGQEIGQVVGGVAQVKINYDDLYIDTSLARVEVGNSPVFANCTHREIQKPFMWSDNHIQLIVNEGSFPKQAQLYLFVIDSNGNPSEGFLINPKAPKNLISIN